MNQVKENNKIQLFTNESFGTIRTVIIDANPWFIAVDVCRILEVTNPTVAMNGLETFEKAKLNLGLRGGDTNIISESGFYTLVLRSRKPVAKPFRIWVTSEVLPSIRKTGIYKAESNKMETMLSNMGCEMKIVYAQINNIESMLEDTREDLRSVVDNITLTTHQQQKLYKAAKDRINYLLGGAHSKKYKSNSKSYFINLWNGLKSDFECSSYKDLNPKYFEMALDYISEWEYIEY